MACEGPFMKSPITGRPAGRIDLVIAGDREAASWFGLEVQAVYFSGSGMRADFEQLLSSDTAEVPQPTPNRHPDWRYSSAQRLMPQLQVKGPTMRRWGAKLAVAVDQPLFEATGGQFGAASTDLNDGDIIWLLVRVNPRLRLVPHHWEVVSLECTSACGIPQRPLGAMSPKAICGRDSPDCHEKKPETQNGHGKH